MRRVLLVDDEPDIRLVVRAMLSGSDWEADEAGSGAEAIERVADSDYDALVLDQRMPEMTGLDVARRLLADGFARPIVIFSAYLSDELEGEARELGVATIDKAAPLDLVEHLERIARDSGS